MRKASFIFMVFLVFSCAVKQEEQVKTEAWQYFYDMGMSSFVVKNYSEAIANFYKATQVAPTEPKVWNMLGVAYMEVQEYEKAEQAFKRAMDINKDYTEAKLNMGILRYRQGRYEEAIRIFQEVLSDEAFPQKHIAFYNLAKSYMAIGREDEYLKNLKKAVAYYPLFVDAQLELAGYYESKEDYEEAKKTYLSLLGLGISGPNIHMGLARVEYGLKNYQSAKEHIKRVLDNKQTTPELKKQAYDLLTKILTEEQQAFVVPKTERKQEDKKQEEKPQEDKTSSQEQKQEERQRVYRIQVGAFSSKASAEKLKDRLERELGLKDVE
ncbi:MAG: tetratricopeptide repeat protein, partial [Aquificota bacterium]